MRYLYFFLLVLSSNCFGQSFKIVGEERICTSPYSYRYSIETSEVGYSYSWFLLGKKIGEGNEVTVKIANASSNELVLESFLNGTSITIKKTLLSIQTPEILPIESFSLCPGDERIINSKEKYNDPITNALWYQDGNLHINDQSLTVSEGGDYSIVYSNEVCKSDSLNFHVDQLKVNLSTVFFDVEYGELLDLELSDELLSTYEVSMRLVESDEIDGVRDQFAVEETGLYEVEFTSGELSCKFAYQEPIQVNVIKGLDYKNVITPNGDGLNDYWVVEGLSAYDNPLIKIYSRWGVLIHQILPYSNIVWDGKYNGKFAPTGTYYYTIEFNDGYSKPMKGDLTVLY